jgi:hypothetical protein
MRWIVGGKAAHGGAASPSQMGRFETKWLTADKNLSALGDLSGQWIDRVHARRPPRGILLDMDSSVSPTRPSPSQNGVAKRAGHRSEVKCNGRSAANWPHWQVKLANVTSLELQDVFDDAVGELAFRSRSRSI